MKLFSSKRRMAVVGLTVALVAGASGLAVAYFTSSGAGTGSAQVGTASPVLINQIGGTPMYNSRIDASAYQASQCFYCVEMGEMGNKVTFAGGVGGPLSDVTVDMANFNATGGPMNITFNIFGPGSGGVPGALLATDEQSFNIPAAPDGGYGSTFCSTPAEASNLYCGIGNFSITFNFASQDITLPATVVYGIEYNDAQDSADGGVNVQMSSESAPNQVSVGTDADSHYLFADSASVAGGNGYNGSSNDVGPGEITCSTVTPAFTEYSTVDGTNASLVSSNNPTGACGAAPYIPAVEFDSAGFGDLFPAGPSQTIDFSITNPGTGSTTVADVTIAVATDTGTGFVEAIPGDTASDISGCEASWFSVTPTPVPVNQTLSPGQTIDWNGAASISMSSPPLTNQDACQGASIGLTFTSD
jgi:hypothetical protein